MAIAITLIEYLSKNKVKYELVKHKHTAASLDSSKSAHIPSSHMSKPVVLVNKSGEHIMAIVSAGNRLSLPRLNNITGQEYSLVSEQKLAELFPDCDRGAIPAMGEAYQMKMLVDDSLLATEHVYIEAGDHDHLIKMPHTQYINMLDKTPHGDISGKRIGISRSARRYQRDWRL